MPTFDRGHTYVNGEDATEDIFNDPWDALETFLNVTKLDDDNLQDGAVTGPKLDPSIQLAVPTSVVATLPVSPANGQVIYYANAAMATAGVVWTLRYTTAIGDSSKWQFVGGPAYRSATDVATNPVNATSPFVIGEGPSLTVPLKGIYRVQFSATVQHTGGGPAFAAFAVAGAVSHGGGNPDTGDVINGNGAASESGYVERQKSLNAGNVLAAAQWVASGAISVTTANRVIAITPERVG